MTITLTAKLRILTPLFLGGADQAPELRPPSLKGALRYWYRSLDPHYLAHEARFFGGAGKQHGQAPFLLRVEQQKPQPVTWRRTVFRHFERREHGKPQKNGLIYLGYPFALGANEGRQYLPPGEGSGGRITVHCVFPRDPAPKLRQALVAALWLLGHVGGLGSRSRRGFGALALEDWGLRHHGPGQAPASWPELDALPILAAEARDGEAWEEGFRTGVAQAMDWFHESGVTDSRTSPMDRPAFGPQASLALGPEAWPVGQWQEARAAMGLRLQSFRQVAQPDLDRVKAYAGGKPLDAAPARATFGLPLTFRFGGRGPRPVELLPYDAKLQSEYERQGSLLHLKPALTRGGLSPCWLRLDGPLPGQDPPATVRRSRRPLPPAPESTPQQWQPSLDQFMKNLGARPVLQGPLGTTEEPNHG